MGRVGLIGTVIVLSVGLAGHADAKAERCTPEGMAGQWERVLKGGQVAKAVWSFAPDGTIACKGKDCARAAGAPQRYTLKKKTVALAFERGAMQPSSCQIKDGFLFMGGGADRGGFTFRKK